MHVTPAEESSRRRPSSHPREVAPRFTIAGAQLSGTGLLIPAGTATDGLVAIIVDLFRVEDTVQWAIGDGLIYGADTLGMSVAQISAALAERGIRPALQTLQNYASVARSIPVSRRREGLSFSHHAEVATLPPEAQDELMTMAIEHGWRVRRLRQERYRVQRPESPDQAAPPELATPDEQDLEVGQPLARKTRLPEGVRRRAIAPLWEQVGHLPVAAAIQAEEATRVAVESGTRLTAAEQELFVRATESAREHLLDAETNLGLLEPERA